MWVIPVVVILIAVAAFAMFVRHDAVKQRRRASRLRMHRRR